MGRGQRTAKREKQHQGSQKERKKSTKTRGRKVEVMASFGIFLHLAILCFFTVSKVHAKNFLIETGDDVKPRLQEAVRDGGHGHGGKHKKYGSDGGLEEAVHEPAHVHAMDGGGGGGGSYGGDGGSGQCSCPCPVDSGHGDGYGKASRYNRWGERTT